MTSALTARAEFSPLSHPAAAFDYLPRGPLERLQLQRLREVVGRAYEHVALYRHRMHKHGVTPEDIASLDDLARLPFCTPGDLEAQWPRALLAVPPAQVMRLHAAAMPSGKPIVVAHTRDDLAASHEILLRALACCGLRAGDVLQNVGGYSLFGDALGLHQAAEALGATVIPTSPGDGQRHAAALKEFGVSAICATPSYFEHLVEQIERATLDLSDLPLRLGIFVDEAWTANLRRRVEAAIGITTLGLIGLPEILGRGMGAECAERNGVHLFEDHFYPEVVDPATGKTLPDGEEGELVVTTLTRQAMPLVRYRTSARTAIIAEPCPCGRTLRRIRGLERASAAAFVVEGVQVFPSQIEAILSSAEGALPPYRIARSADEGPERIELQIEVTPQIFRDQVAAIEGLQSRLVEEIERVLGVRVPVRFVEPYTITRRGVT